MKKYAYLILFCICSFLLSSCSRNKFSLHSSATTQNALLSQEIENYREKTTKIEIKEDAEKTYSETLTKEQKSIISSIHQRNIERTKTSEQSRLQTKIAASKIPSQKPVSDLPIDLKKHDTILWKLGGIICMTGMVFLGLGLTILLKVNRGPYTIWIIGILIGLGLMIISLPLLIMGAAMDSGNHNNNQEQNETK